MRYFVLFALALVGTGILADDASAGCRRKRRKAAEATECCPAPAPAPVCAPCAPPAPACGGCAAPTPAPACGACGN